MFLWLAGNFGRFYSSYRKLKFYCEVNCFLFTSCEEGMGGYDMPELLAMRAVFTEKRACETQKYFHKHFFLSAAVLMWCDLFVEEDCNHNVATLYFFPEEEICNIEVFRGPFPGIFLRSFNTEPKICPLFIGLLSVLFRCFCC